MTLLIYLYFFKIEKYKNINKIALIIHAGNIDVFKQIVNDYPDFFNNKIDLYISCNKKEDELTIKEMFPQSFILLCDNKGMDIGPFLLMIKYLKNYNYYIKIHTKSNKEWLGNLIKPIYNKLNFFLTNEPSDDIEMYGAKKYMFKGMVDKCDYTYLRDINERNFNYGFDCKKDMYFIGGTIFVFNYSYFKELLKIKDINYEYSILETGHPNHTKENPKKAHAWEYFLGFLIYLNNKNITLI